MASETARQTTDLNHDCTEPARPERDNETRVQRPAILRVGNLVAEYTAGQTPSGEWFALGSVRECASGPLRPARILVGSGVTHDAALDDLRLALQQEEPRR